MVERPPWLDDRVVGRPGRCPPANLRPTDAAMARAASACAGRPVGPDHLTRNRGALWAESAQPDAGWSMVFRASRCCWRSNASMPASPVRG